MVTSGTRLPRDSPPFTITALNSRAIKILPYTILILILSSIYFLIHINNYPLKDPNSYIFDENATNLKIKSLLQATVVFTLDEVVVPIDIILKGEPIILKQNDSRILNYIKKHGIIHEPSDQPYSLTNPDKDPSMGQGQFIRKYLSNQRNGFFIECGALDGETRSNTLYLEKELGWKGLLVEGDPKNFDLLLKKNRKAWSAKTCLSLKPYPQEVMFMQQFNLGKIVDRKSEMSKKSSGATPVLCFPLFTLLSYLKVFEIDYFSLDVEGNELDVLRTIPFDSVLIKTLSVEFLHTEGGKSAVMEFMQSKGYHHVETITHYNNLANDFIFAHSSMGNFTL